MSIFGEFIHSDHRYIDGDHGTYFMSSSAVADTPIADFADNKPLSAASAMILTNNLGVLAKENLRHLISTPWHKGYWVNSKTNYDWTHWTDILDMDTSDIASRNPEDQLSWGGTYNHCFGPFTFISDREMTSGQLTLRNLRVMGTIFANVAGNTIVVGITKDKFPPSHGNYLMLGSYTYPATVFGSFDFIVKATDPIPLASVPTDLVYPASAEGGSCHVVKGYIWVGVTQQNSNHAINSIDIFETRAES